MFTLNKIFVFGCKKKISSAVALLDLLLIKCVNVNMQISHRIPLLSVYDVQLSSTYSKKIWWVISWQLVLAKLQL